MMARIPHSSTANGPLNYSQDQGVFNVDLPERFNRHHKKPSVPHFENATPGLRAEPNRNILRYMEDQDNVNANAKEGTWLRNPEFPTTAELSLDEGEAVSLPANKIKGKWKSIEKYLRTHYELLREDAISPLRDTIDTFKKDPDMTDDSATAVYEKVHVVGFTFTQQGVAARIKFSTGRAGKVIQWQSSRRLVSGTIIALSRAKNRFQTDCIVATVAARPLTQLELDPPEVDIFFARTDEIVLDPHEELVMLESRQGYYEANRHTMRALQKLYQEGAEKSPLSQHICSLSPKVDPPQYLQSDPILNLSAAAPEGNKSSYRHINVLEQWPEPPIGIMDETQWAAAQEILTKSLAIIQGPPGTGKTHISTIALEILVQNHKVGDPPILIAAQTNHALDQLLERVSTFEPDYIRLGGRSTSIQVKKRALYEVRAANPRPHVTGSILGKARAQAKYQIPILSRVLEPLSQADDKPIPIEIFLHYRVINQKQLQSLEEGVNRWIVADDEDSDPLKLWLGADLLPFNLIYKNNNSLTEELDEDLEFEQLKEHEAENGLNDEEDIELLQGPFVELKDNYQVHQSYENDELATGLLQNANDLWDIIDSQRPIVYNFMRRRLMEEIKQKFHHHAQIYDETCRNLKIGKWERDATYLQQAKIIGLTTTGLSKYRPLIASLEPRIVLIEEAAEVIEAPIAVACMKSLQQLILVGDHQQLQGHCSVLDLEGSPYHLNVSLFERLVNNGIPFKTLLHQRRMAPEFRELISPLYPDLRDHVSVIDRSSPPWGMGDTKSFFLNHPWYERKDSTFSTFNEEEASLIAGFYKYLINNEVDSRGITILTFYHGQRKRILSKLRADLKLKNFYHNVKTVDSYQGEENVIVILSLVRSNDNDQIGFLQIDNRVCVALSRARYGFYIFGNALLLERCSPLWNKVIDTMSSSGRLDDKLPITCQRHGHKTFIKYPGEWDGNDGGCNLKCQAQMPCGHQCQLNCHPYPHNRVDCQRPCERQMVCQHRCLNKCFESCFCDCPTFKKMSGLKTESTKNGTGKSRVSNAPIPEPLSEKYRQKTLSKGKKGGDRTHALQRATPTIQDHVYDQTFPALGEPSQSQISCTGRTRYAMNYTLASRQELDMGDHHKVLNVENVEKDIVEDWMD